MRVLVTRPVPDAATTAARLEDLGHDVLCAPLIDIVSVAHRIDSPGVQALAITSANAIRSLDAVTHARLRALPVYVVGSRTAEAARAAGFVDVIEAGQDAEALAARLARLDARAGPILHLSGRDIARDLDALIADGPKIRRVVVYDAVPAGRLPETVIRELTAGRIDAVLHFSPRSARIFGRLIKNAGLAEGATGLAHLALSGRVAEALRDAGLPVAAIADEPTEAALIACLGISAGDSAG